MRHALTGQVVPLAVSVIAAALFAGLVLSTGVANLMLPSLLSADSRAVRLAPVAGAADREFRGTFSAVALSENLHSWREVKTGQDDWALAFSSSRKRLHSLGDSVAAGSPVSLRSDSVTEKDAAASFRQ